MANPTFSTGLSIPVTGTTLAVTWSTQVQTTFGVTLNGKQTQVLITPVLNQTSGTHSLQLYIANTSITTDSSVICSALDMRSSASGLASFGVELVKFSLWDGGIYAYLKIIGALNGEDHTASTPVVKFKLNIVVL